MNDILKRAEELKPEIVTLGGATSMKNPGGAARCSPRPAPM